MRSFEGTARRHQDLIVWQDAIAFVKEVYEVSARFPKEEQFGLTSQLRRAAIAVPSNIAEGAARGGTKKFVRYLSIARGSLAEAETQLYLARELGYISSTTAAQTRIEELFRMLNGWMLSLKNRAANRTP